MTVDLTALVLANLPEPCDRRGDHVTGWWLIEDANKLVCRACLEDLGGDPDGD